MPPDGAFRVILRAGGCAALVSGETQERGVAELAAAGHVNKRDQSFNSKNVAAIFGRLSLNGGPPVYRLLFDRTRSGRS